MVQRIIPVSSGKGGVGKTTFAVNFALGLSRIAPTVLVDLDAGTSSVRSSIRVKVARDLYHFHRQGVDLADCITRLDTTLDPEGRYRNFGFIASPKHFIDELANPDEPLRRRLAAAIGHLPADYIVLDLRAGLDRNVVDFLPFTNSGVLIFTPHHPAATRAASDIVKAIVFRSLRILFGRGSKFYEQPGMARYQPLILELLSHVEDVYDEALPNLDAFLLQLAEAFGDHPILSTLTDSLDSFRVHYVLNMFDGVKQGYENAIVPFVRNLSERVSARLRLSQLGWIVYDERVHRASCDGVPVLLDSGGSPPTAGAPPPEDAVTAELAALESEVLGRKRRPPASPRSKTPRPPRFELPETEDVLAGQLNMLQAMYSDRPRDTVGDNFSYLVYRALGYMGADMATSEFGQTRILSPEEVTDWFLARQRLAMAKAHPQPQALPEP